MQSERKKDKGCELTNPKFSAASQTTQLESSLFSGFFCCLSAPPQALPNPPRTLSRTTRPSLLGTACPRSGRNSSFFHTLSLPVVASSKKTQNIWLVSPTNDEDGEERKGGGSANKHTKTDAHNPSSHATKSCPNHMTGRRKETEEVEESDGG